VNYNITDKIQLLNNGDEQTFDEVYTEYYQGLLNYAFTILTDEVMAEEMVHQIFLKIWERKSPIQVHTSLKAYLYRSIHNECLNYIKHQKVKQKHELHTLSTVKTATADAGDRLQFKQLEQRVAAAINDLPQQCRIIFQLSRFEDLKYAQIAQQLGVSVKTVEAQMTKALKRLRVQLVDYLPLLLCLITYLKN
jgi:RNA polymerase sigma-70 factor (ECF subfamily)